MPSVWATTCRDDSSCERMRLVGDVQTDVLIVGGGIAGILCAHRLARRGVSCAVAEADRVGAGVTQNTTAKITLQHGLFYAEMLRKSGQEAARQYADVNRAALDEYRALAERIPCDLEEKTAYVYSVDDRMKLEREADAYARLGIASHFREETPLPLRTVGAVGVENQAQFHPLKLLCALAKDLTVYEDTPIRAIEGSRAVSERGSITAKHIILATHFPMVNVLGLYAIKLYQHRSYVVAVRGGPDIGGMYLDERQEGHSFRNYGDLLFIGGGDHRTGRRGGGYDEVRRLAKSAYPEAKEAYAWATQDCMSLDGRPYVGLHRRGADNLYVATGFNKWGMTGAMAAAMVLEGLIVEGRSDYERLFSPRRSMLRPQLFLNMLHSAAGYLSFGKRCPHMGCALVWNAAEQSYDCPCHGSRFDRRGGILNNPAKKGIRTKGKNS